VNLRFGSRLFLWAAASKCATTTVPKRRQAPLPSDIAAVFGRAGSREFRFTPNARTRGQRLHKLLMKQGRHRAERLKLLGVAGQQRRDHLPSGCLPPIRGRAIHPVYWLVGGQTLLTPTGIVIAMADGLQMLHHCDLAVRKAQVFADLARDNLAHNAWDYRSDDLCRMLVDVQQHLQRLRACVEGDMRAGVA
jgi:hypothetical protein